MEFESVKSRLQSQSHLSFLEFNYMLLQAYDFAFALGASKMQVIKHHILQQQTDQMSWMQTSLAKMFYCLACLQAGVGLNLLLLYLMIVNRRRSTCTTFSFFLLCIDLVSFHLTKNSTKSADLSYLLTNPMIV